MTKFFYGNYVHEQDEVYPHLIRYETVNNGRNIPWYLNAVMVVKGSLCGCTTQADLNDKIDALNDAYKYHYKDAGFLLNNGTIGEHYFRSDDQFNLTGNRVAFRSWDNVEPTELANVRSYTIAIEAKFETSYTSILDLQETITVQGSLDPHTRRYSDWSGNMIGQQIYGSSGPLRVTQSGFIISKDIAGFALPGPWYPNHENKRQRVISRTSGKSWGSAHGRPGYGYRGAWRYVMEIPSENDQEPNNMNSINFGSGIYGSGSVAYPYNGPGGLANINIVGDPVEP